MQRRTGLRSGLPWLLGGLALVVAISAVSILASEDDADRAPTWILATIGWAVILGGIALAVKGVLIFMRNVSSRQAWRLALFSAAALVASIVLHNVVYAITGEEEPFFFLVAVVVAPLLLIASLIRAIWPGGGSRGGTIGASR